MVIDRDHMARIIAGWARSEPVIRKAFLYGSVARNEWKPGSDIDVAIQLNWRPAVEVELAVWGFEGDRLAESLQVLLPAPLQLEWYDPVETPIVHNGIVQSSTLVYDQARTA